MKIFFLEEGFFLSGDEERGKERRRFMLTLLAMQLRHVLIFHILNGLLLLTFS